MAAAEKKRDYSAQERYAKAQAKDGLIRATVWVPTEHRSRLLKYAARLRNEA